MNGGSGLIMKYQELRSSMQQDMARHRIRIWLSLFVLGLVLSGVTAFPLQTEVHWLDVLLHKDWLVQAARTTGVLAWIDRVNEGLGVTNKAYPFLAYGTDWLAFAHLVIAVAFIGPCRDPVRNKWVISFGLICCAGVIPLALIAGAIRGIPLPWRLIDCSFGFFGCIPLLRCLRWIHRP